MIIGKRTVLAKTCLLCGQLVMARQFSRVNKVYLNSYCNKCKYEGSTRPLVQEHQQEALSKASKHRKPWSDADLYKLEELVAAGRTGPSIAIELKRSLYSIYTAKHKMKASE